MIPADVGPVVAVAGLTFAYANGAALFEDLTFNVDKGSMLCVTGRSGVGKSTLLYCLAGVLRAQGKINIMGSPMPAKASARAAMRLRTSGFIFQRGELLPELSVLENVALPLRLVGESRSTAHKRGREALVRLAIENCAERTPHEISGGQAQRASVARALIHEPAVVFADEPTASLDSISREAVLSVLHDAVARGVTVICATHDAAVVERADSHLTLTERVGG